MKNLVRLLDFHFQPRWNNREYIYIYNIPPELTFKSEKQYEKQWFSRH